MRPLSPWDLARSADGCARDADRGGSAAAGPATAGSPAAGMDGLLAVGGTVVLRACLALGLAGAVVAVLPTSGVVVAALVGVVAPVVLTGVYLRASTPVARRVLLGSLARGYRTSLACLVLVAAVIVRSAGVRLGWVDAEPPPPAWAFAAGAALVVSAQTQVLRRRARRGRA